MLNPTESQKNTIRNIIKHVSEDKNRTVKIKLVDMVSCNMFVFSYENGGCLAVKINKQGKIQPSETVLIYQSEFLSL